MSVSGLLRRTIWERDGGICGLCHLPVAFDRSMHVDHIVPVERDGCDHAENLRATHKACNVSRDYQDIPEPHCTYARTKWSLATYVDQQDRANMETIRRAYKLASDSAAIRFALQQAAAAAVRW
jgi:5-methylcytosine-specific restriction endonuclease McrA